MRIYPNDNLKQSCCPPPLLSPSPALLLRAGTAL